MEDVSNKTILALLTMALVVMVVGTTISVIKISNLSPSGQDFSLSGAVTQTGTADLAISATVSFTINDSTIDFGTGYITPGTAAQGGAYIWSDTMTQYDGTTWNNGGVSNWVNTTDMGDAHMIINNTGTVAIVVNVSSTSPTAEAWYCPTDSDCGGLNTFSKVEATGIDPDGNCGGTINESVGYAYILNDTGNQNVTLCTSLSTGTNAFMNVTLNLSVPSNVESSIGTLTLVFTAIEAS